VADRLRFGPLWRSYAYLRPYWPLVAGAYLATLLIIALNVSLPQLIRGVVDRSLLGGERAFFGWAVSALLALALARAVLTFAQQRWLEVACQNVAYDLRNDLQIKLTDLSFSFHDRTETGQLLSRAIQDVERIRFLTGRATWRVVDALALMAGTGAVLVWMSPALAVLVLLTMPLLVHRGYVFASRARPLALVIQDQLGRLTSQVEQSLRGLRVVKAFAQEPAEVARFERQNEEAFELAALNSRLDAVNTPLMDLIVNLGLVLILLYGGWLVIQQSLTLGALVAFTTYLAQLSSPVRTLGRVIPAISMASAAGERIFAVLDAAPEVRDAPRAVRLPPLRGQVQFEQVSLAYAGERAALNDLSFEAQPGQVVALLGATGAGKSTITYLISRFYDPTQGRVLIDGHDLRQVTRASLRRQIGVVLQETVLFAATVRENIAFGRPAATEAEIEAAARAAQAHDFILSFKDGYQTVVGERGVTLSGGQRQRLALARAFLTNPRILVLDDSTSAIDSATEDQIQKAIFRAAEGRTTLLITHRLSQIRWADLIVVLRKGRLAAVGSHDELLRTSEAYRQIFARYQ
jgi:ATP-binding cassette subfamily B protein